MPVRRFATWNVNSLKARWTRVEEWLEVAAPDVCAFQETKLADDAFPALSFATLGYESVHCGQGRWNGVAIASRLGISEVTAGFAAGIAPDPEARLLTAHCGPVVVVVAYAPNGRALGHPQYDYKLDWFDRLRQHLDVVAGTGDLVLLCGDLNIAPSDRDVWDPGEVHGSTHVSGPERERFEALVDWGMVDVFRQRYPSQPGLYSWWDYRAGNFHKHKGMRIDHILASQELAARSTGVVLIDRNARKGRSPSDHAPVFADFDLAG